MPLPLLAQRGGIERIALSGIHDHVGTAIGLPIGADGFAFLTHDGPPARPVYGIQMDHATVSLLVLKVQEPVFAVFRVNPASLMGAVDGGLALCQHNLMLIRTVWRLGAHGELETRGHTTGRTHDPVPAVALIELRAFAGTVLCAIAVEDDDRLSDGAHAVRRHLAHR